jgi:hypothetical protein
MNCEICGKKDPMQIVILPIKKPDGSYITLACLECAKSSSAYCQKHECPHIGFGDGKTMACIDCIEEMVAEEKGRAESVLESIENNLVQDELEDLLEWAKFSSSITGDTEAVCVVRAIATKAKRINKTFQKILDEVVTSKSAENILAV